MDMRIFDVTGAERDWAWVQATFGNVQIAKPTDEQLVNAKGVFRIIELREVEASLDLNCRVQGVDQNDQVAYYWPGAPVLEQYDPPTARWENQAFRANIILGKATLLMGGQSDYNPATQQGAYGIWPLKPWMASEYIKGLGWLMATHYRHLDVTFKLELIENGNGGNGEDPDLEAVVAQLKRIADSVDSIDTTLEEFRAWLTRP